MTPLTRLPGWETRLDQFLTANQARPFNRGAFDCVRFVADAIFQIVAIDLAAEFREQYHDDAEAKALVLSWGADGFYGKVNEIFLGAGFAQVNWKQAMRGDPGLLTPIMDDWSGGLGLCIGSTMLSPVSNGLKPVPMRRARMCWHIPFHA